MTKDQSTKQYDLEERTFQFAQDVRAFVRRLPVTVCNLEDGKQLVRSSVSVGANYMEANEGLSEKDFLTHAKISRKEAKESRYWLRLLHTGNDEELQQERATLVRESQELMNIFGSITRKSGQPLEH